LCNSCASLAGLVLSFIACFSLLVIAPLTDPLQSVVQLRSSTAPSYFSAFLDSSKILLIIIVKDVKINKMPEFCMLISRQFFPNLGGGVNAPVASPTHPVPMI